MCGNDVPDARRLAVLICEALKAADPNALVDESEGGDPTIIDGSFDMDAVSGYVLERLAVDPKL
jgi:hypothetical protein